MVVLTSDGKRIQSFKFKFSEEHDGKLCIYYDGYLRSAAREPTGCSLVQSRDASLLALS